MRPLNEDGKPWGAEASGSVLASIRTECIAELHKAEEVESKGQLNAENRWSPVVEVLRDEENPALGSVRTVNPLLAAVKHSGAEMVALVRSRWAGFCSKPQDEKVHLDKISHARRTAELAAMRTDGEAVETRVTMPTKAVTPVQRVETNAAVLEPDRPAPPRKFRRSPSVRK